ncbi:MAG: hypothetical protein WD768_01120 [Phycisphaeraceae bacterium]
MFRSNNLVTSSQLTRIGGALFCAALFAFAMPADAGAVTVAAGGDSYIQLSVPTTNFGTSSTLLVKHNTDTFLRKAYVRYDTSSIDGLAGDASLTFNFVETGVGNLDAAGLAQSWQFQVYGLNNGDAGEFWVEGNGGADNNPAGEINWNNAPANNTATGNGVLANATSLGTFSVLGKGIGPVVFSSDALVDFLNSDTDGLATFILVRNTPQTVGTNNYAHGISSRENTAIGGTLLNVVLVPEPATGLLALMGMTVLGRRRRVA